jgi:hypothetical protein
MNEFREGTYTPLRGVGSYCIISSKDFPSSRMPLPDLNRKSPFIAARIRNSGYLRYIKIRRKIHESLDKIG